MNDIAIEVIQAGDILVVPTSQIISATVENQNPVSLYVDNQSVSMIVTNGDIVDIDITSTNNVMVEVPEQKIQVEVSTVQFDGITDAPSDDSIYARRNKTWVVIGESGGLPDAPIDGEIYGRKDGAWSAIGLIVLNIDGGDSESFP